MERYVCIHGHFYQPPRENPWLEDIELQDSASPYHDWNERITEECYRRNAAFRILDSGKRIRRPHSPRLIICTWEAAPLRPCTCLSWLRYILFLNLLLGSNQPPSSSKKSPDAPLRISAVPVLAPRSTAASPKVDLA
jgi:hypothetical protein